MSSRKYFCAAPAVGFVELKLPFASQALDLLVPKTKPAKCGGLCVQQDEWCTYFKARLLLGDRFAVGIARESAEITCDFLERPLGCGQTDAGEVAVNDFAQPFEADKTGLRVAAYGPDLRGFKIIGVLAGSAAEAAGCRVGDFIETVDGKPAARFALHQLRELFRAPTPAQWKLGLKREGQQLTLTIAAKSII